MGLEDHIDIHWAKEEEKKCNYNSTVMNQKKQQLGKGVIIQSKAPRNHALIHSLK